MDRGKVLETRLSWSSNLIGLWSGTKISERSKTNR